MKYPRMTIDLSIIRNNVKTIVELCNKQDIKIAGVTKVFCGNPEIAKAYIDGGVSYLADSRIENLIRMKDLDIPKIMLRLPMKSEAEYIVEYVDISLNSELETIKLLSEKAMEKNKIHKIILMVDLGDLREGFYEEDSLLDCIENIISLKGIEIIGLGTNLTCYGGVIPTEEVLNRLVKLERQIEEKYNIELEILSGGNSSTVHLVENCKINGLNNLRLGESLILGIETAYGEQIKDTDDGGFRLQAEIIEVKEKPSVPIGEIGKDAFGNVPTFIDRGIRKRILCAIGKQDIDFDGLYPLDSGITILGGSSDHLILDSSDSEINYKVGDIIEFKLSYVGILRAMTSEYIEKEIIK
ncbi:alanine/ornithine racemase family PLP-dependent enzyme [Tissierella pigra]|uniref:Alanine/ornithine racemase family PLP-dependent enzyme n=1 Tax=Tissierella pigra TaxID=2607614 RepID=A0A6N7XXQ6_9FIRM|nr:ornithine racemase Orr [Tissierella pigra]MBU5426772.1 alanine/ornithine racemase family PLP-dependent enzyme [Tissierella pigra]MSU01354.1 alanine/ornithine racemase family PLP-dependent enzyme [Tissierella pigra]